MLVLSRRKNEEFLFPELGISIKVVGTGSKTIRIGIDAPKEIRVVRGELNQYQTGSSRPTSNSGSENQARSTVRQARGLHGQSQCDRNQRQVLDQIDQANLAVHLAQNQLQQGLTEHAEQALRDAIECLCDLELRVAGYEAEATSQINSGRSTGTRQNSVAVHESRSGYQTRIAKPTSTMVVDAEMMSARQQVSGPIESQLERQIDGQIESKNQTVLAVAVEQARKKIDWLAIQFSQAGIKVVIDENLNNLRSID